MPQRRYFNWQDNDSTRDLNRVHSIIMPPGRYYGFDGLSPSGLTLPLTMLNTGYKKVNDGATAFTRVGVLVTHEGGIVEQEGDLEFTFAANTTGFERIDLIVCSHIYLESIGGAAATYSVVQGTPGAGIPALPTPQQMVVIGAVTLPANTSALTLDMYSPARPPFFTNDTSLVRSTDVNLFTVQQEFYSIQTHAGIADLLVASGEIKPSLANDYANNKQLLFPDGSVTDYVTVNTIEGWADFLPGFTFTFFTPVPLLLSSLVFKDAGNASIHIEANSAFEVTRRIGGVTEEWWVAQGGSAGLDKKNKFRQINQWNAVEALPITNFRLETGSATGNMWNLDLPEDKTIRYIQSHDVSFAAPDEGTIIILNTEGAGWLTFEHDASLVPPGFKPVFLPQGVTEMVVQAASGAVLLIETANYWKVLLMNSEELSAKANPWVPIEPAYPFFLSPASGLPDSRKVRYRKQSNLLRFSGILSIVPDVLLENNLMLICEIPETHRTNRKIQCVVMAMIPGEPVAAEGVTSVQLILQLDEASVTGGGLRINPLSAILGVPSPAAMWVRLDDVQFDLTLIEP